MLQYADKELTKTQDSPLNWLSKTSRPAVFFKYRQRTNYTQLD